jgi:hypothetical protein
VGAGVVTGGLGVGEPGDGLGPGHGVGMYVVVVTIVGLGLAEVVMLGSTTRLGTIRVTVGNGYGARISGRTGTGAV